MSAMDKYTPRFDKEAMKKLYVELCAIRDATNADPKVKVLFETKEKAVNLAEEYRIKADAAVKAWREARGGSKWNTLKNEIGTLAKLVSGHKAPTAEEMAEGMALLTKSGVK